jgi:molybdate-binding protein
MRKIAIIKTGWYDDYSKVIESITDWKEVTEEDFTLLNRYTSKKDMVVLEFFATEKIPSLIEEFVVIAKKEQAELDKQKALAEKVKHERALKKRAKTEKQERELLVQLQQKFKE